MKKKSAAATALVVLLVVGGAVSCRTSQAARLTAPATSEAAGVAFESAKYAFAVVYPANWVQISKGESCPLSLVPKSAADPKDGAPVPSLEIEVPKLPAHIPGMIPIGSVADGYVDDLKKKYPDTHIDERVSVTVAACNGRRVVSSMTNGNRPWRDMAVMVCHKDRVYIISADCRVEDYSAVRAAFDGLVASVKWTK